ncbi:uncharacterized protein XM38_043490 [Halomicronema hongdechloris C2206]|uniref:NADP-dependent oxidoreductase domain-containing protein n=1 Tax=Halomicronema hongdechloris C2206 TaxID=1641165 RepID=A0A1Z3HSV8_9CYAN|nr:aldo/keto reductase [Halomicronema hongdechloris]ASC73384.1 uncharacterized protein XM38_043490 [Halomicronema hongdechloris C2206]
MQIQTIQGQPASILGLAGQEPMESGCVDLAWQAGVNYFFSYDLGDSPLLRDLHQLLKQHREQAIVATGSERRELKSWQTYIEQVRQTLAIDTVDILFAEYVSPADDWQQVMTLLEQLYEWKAAGLIRYVGVTTHTRAIAQRLLQESRCDVLMHRYNMAHRKAEAAVLPAALAADIPVVAFTSTRWGTLLQGHPAWPTDPPTAADCYRFGLHQPAIRLVLTAPKTRDDLEANLAVLEAPSLSAEEVAHWQRYGDLVYGQGQDAFETNWP